MKRDYFALWGLLAAAFCIFLGISAFGDEVSIGSTTWRTSGMASRIFGDDAADDDLLPAALLPDTAAAIASDAAVIKPDTSATAPSAAHALAHPDTAAVTDIAASATAAGDSTAYTVLFIGDSMLEGLGPRLAAYCDASGFDLYNVIWYSSTSEIWGDARLLTKYIARVKPDFIFICLGANELFVRDIATKRKKHVRSILAEAGSIPYLWIGPPNWKPDTGINALVSDNAPEGRFFLSDGMEFDRQKDGAHPTGESAIAWMDSVMRWMPAHCPQAPRFAEPTKDKGRAKRQFIHQPGKNP